jgi:putative ABC transport system ATP-binding protein
MARQRRFGMIFDWHRYCCNRFGATRASSAKTPMFKMTGVSKSYRKGCLESFALRNFSIHVRAGEFVAVTGPSGCGKTAFLAIAGLLETHSEGEFEINHVNIRGMSDYERSRLRNQQIGFVFQSFNFIDDLTVCENVEMPLRYRGLLPKQRLRRVESSLYRVGLENRANDFPSELSGGDQQRVAVARALAGSPRVLLADEPTGNLDVAMAASVMDLLGDLHRDGVTIIVVTHSAEMAKRAEREVHVVDGSIVTHPLLHSPAENKR